VLIRWVFLFVIQFSAVSVLAEPLRLSTTLNPPYQVMQGNQLVGISVDIINCIFGEQKLEYNLTMMPWVRGVNALKQHSTDGIFTSIPMPELEEVAELSQPLALEKWFWYFRPGTNIHNIKKLRLAGIRQGNELQWLMTHGYSVDIQVNNMQQLAYLLKNGRIDAFLADKRAADANLQSLEWEPDTFLSVFSVYQPLGVYLPRNYLSANRDFLQSFNSTINQCRPTPMALDKTEQRKVDGWLDKYLFPAIPEADIHNALRNHNKKRRNYSDETIVRMDQQWKQLSPLYLSGKTDDAVIRDVDKNTLSAVLYKLQQASGGVVNEIFITDKRGMSVAHSVLTSDFYHGDEESFLQVVASPDGRYTGPIQYDDSTGRFQVKIALRLNEGPELLGVLMIGIDVEHTLQASL